MRMRRLELLLIDRRVYAGTSGENGEFGYRSGAHIPTRPKRLVTPTGAGQPIHTLVGNPWRDQPDELSKTVKKFWNVYVGPEWAGGARRRFEYVPRPPCHTESKLLFQQHNQDQYHCGAVELPSKDDRGW